ncbi:MAG: TonB-dependent receptor [Alteromonadaceae bacterium]|nr:TonB-dependent receptor [Alteromonadaceae bacterium]
MKNSTVITLAYLPLLSLLTFSCFGTEKKPDSLEKIQIRGIRGSLVKSILIKRLNDSVVDTITAEDIGKFPDKNVAEALQRITGVSLTRVQGEGERVGVRGTAPSQNRTYLNGQNIASTDWWISSQPNRGFNYTLLPAELVSSLEVHKTPEADQDEGSLGGSINIKTHAPLDTQDDMFIGTAQLQYSDVSGKTDPQLSLFYNHINKAKNFGLLISLSRHERSLRRDGLESWGWAERNFNKNAQGQLTQTSNKEADLTNIWTPAGGGSAVFQQQRKLSNAMVNLQYQPNLDWNIELNTLYSVLDANNSNQNFLWQPSSVYDRDGYISDYKIIDNTLVQANYTKVPDNNSKNIPFNTSMEAIWRKSQIKTSLVHLLVEHNFDYWQSQYQIGFTQASGGTSKDYTSQWAANTEYSVDFSDTKNVIANYQVSPLKANAWQISEVRQDAQDSTDSEFFAQTDFEYQFDRPFLQSVKFGAKYKQHQRDFIRLRSKNGGYTGMAGNLNWTLADFSASFPTQYLQGIGSEKTLKEYAFVDINKLDQAFNQLTFIQGEEKPSTFDIKENTLASYVKLNFSGNNFRGNFGIRVVHTQQNAAAFQKIVETESIFREYVWSTTNKSYTDILPSINLTMDFSEDVLFRVGASKVMSRPEYHHLMPSTNYNVTQAQGAGGNPNLDPFRATNFDVGIEWYFDEAALFSMAAFHKNIQSFIDIKRYQEVYENRSMIINRPINGSGGSIYGLELNLQQELFYGFGVIANYTFVDGKRKDSTTGENIEIPGNSKHSANLTSYFENDWLTTRLSYNFRTEFATGVGEEITDDYGQWDINLSFILTEEISLVFEGINLTDSIIYTYERNQYAPVGIYRNGRRFYAGVRVSL